MTTLTMTVSHRAWLSAVLLGLASLLLYTINIERAPHHDELYHILAAEGLLATGEPVIGEAGRYWRGYPLTWLVAQSFALFEPGLAAARLPAVLCMVGLVVLLFLFLHREAGALAAWLGAGLFAVSPFAIELAQFVRFYSLQSLLFFAAAWIVYAIASGPWAPARQLPLAGGALLLLGVAFHLQPTTLLGAAGLTLWAAGALLLPWLIDPAVPSRRKRHVLVALVAAGLALISLLWATGLFAELWRDYRSTALFNRPQADQFWYYHGWYSLLYPTLWTTSGLLAIGALIVRPRLASFLLVVFVVGFLLNSFAASKSMRYIAYAQPFLFGFWGLALGVLLAGAGDLYTRSRERLAQRLTLLSGAPARALATLLVIGALASLVVANPASLRSVALLAGVTVPPELPPNDWPAARPALEPWLKRVEAVVTTDELRMLHYYGRADFLLSATKLEELPAARRQPFGRDFRTDVPVIADAASLELIMRCRATGLFVTQAQHAADGARARPEVAEVARLLDNHARELELPRQSRLVAFVWEGGPAAADPAACAVLAGSRD